MPDFDPITLAGKKAKGKRPYFFKDQDVERVLNITMAIAGELAVTRERLDTIERLLESKNIVCKEDIEAFEPDTLAANERAAWNQEYIARILRIVQQSMEALDDKKDPSGGDSYEKIMEDLSTS